MFNGHDFLKHRANEILRYTLYMNVDRVFAVCIIGSDFRISVLILVEMGRVAASGIIISLLLCFLSIPPKLKLAGSWYGNEKCEISLPMCGTESI